MSIPTDFNDMSVIHGIEVVRDHIKKSLEHVAANAPPAPPVEAERPTIEIILQRYAYAMPDAKVWDSHQKILLKQHAFKGYIGADLFAEWLKHKKRRTVQVNDVLPEMASAQVKGGGGLADAIERYVYLNPSSMAWDKHLRQVVALTDLRYAIADCFDQWVKHPRRQEVAKENLVFDPTEQADPESHINMYRGLPLKPDPDTDKSRHIRAMLYQLCNKNDDVFEWLRCWLAYPLQNIGAKMATAVLMHSDVHGSGKSFFFDGVMRQVYGEYCRTFGQQQLESQYNDWISQTLFGVFEEVFSRFHRYSHTGTVKHLITGKTIRIEKKYISGWEEFNHMNCVFLSNEVQPFPVEPSDRRFLVIWPEHKLLDELQNGVDQELRNGGAASFYNWLLQTDLSGFGPHSKPPITEAKGRLIDFGRPGWEVFWHEWKSGHLEVPYCSCLIGDLFAVYVRWCVKHKENPASKNKFVGFIRSKETRRRDLHYKSVSKGSRKGTFFIIHQCPSGKTQEEWLGGCVDVFAEAEDKSRIIDDH